MIHGGVPLVACLTVTNRPEWAPFVRYQVEKQVYPSKKHIVIQGHGARIAALRTMAMEEARRVEAEYIAWFDDDDWASPDRLLDGVAHLNQRGLSAVGNVRSWFISAVTRKGTLYQAPEGIIFNGAVFRRKLVPQEFDTGFVTGEDTEWLTRWHDSRPNYQILGEPMHAWLCHGTNITNRADRRTFEEDPPALLSAEDWALVP